MSSESVVDPTATERFEVVVVGAGQAGLAIGHFLARDARSFVILEAGAAVGTAWRERWDSLTLFTPRRYDALPGLAFPGEPDGYPTRDEVVAYLEAYADTFALPIELYAPVTSLVAGGDGFVLTAGGRSIVAEQVVVATGPFQSPATPQVGPLERRGSDAQRRLPTPGRRPARPRAGGRRREHGLPDREGAVGDQR